MPIIIPSPSISGIAVSDLLTRLDFLMTDEDRVRWGVPERLDWLTDAAREIVTRRPAARAVTRTIELVDGPLQSAPANTAQLLDVMRNRDPFSESGRPISIADRLLIDRAEPAWQDKTPGPTIHYMLDNRSPTSFYVYPPAIAGAMVEVLIGEPPDAVTSADDTLDMRPEFINAILNWALYRCHSKDSEYAQGSVAAQHYQAFQDTLGSEGQASIANSAKTNSV